MIARHQYLVVGLHVLRALGGVQRGCKGAVPQQREPPQRHRTGHSLLLRAVVLLHHPSVRTLVYHK
jgi:hypothetical protein